MEVQVSIRRLTADSQFQLASGKFSVGSIYSIDTKIVGWQSRIGIHFILSN